MHANHAPDEDLYFTIQRFLKRTRIRRRISAFHLEADVVAQEIWIRLVKYHRRAEIRNVSDYVNQWGPPQIDRLIDRGRKHQINRDPRGVT